MVINSSHLISNHLTPMSDSHKSIAVNILKNVVARHFDLPFSYIKVCKAPMRWKTVVTNANLFHDVVYGHSVTESKLVLINVEELDNSALSLYSFFVIKTRENLCFITATLSGLPTLPMPISKNSAIIGDSPSVSPGKSETNGAKEGDLPSNSAIAVDEVVLNGGNYSEISASIDVPVTLTSSITTTNICSTTPTSGVIASPSKMKYTLAVACGLIETLLDCHLASVSYEDGSGSKFNFTVIGDKYSYFIDLKRAIKDEEYLRDKHQLIHCLTVTVIKPKEEELSSELAKFNVEAEVALQPPYNFTLFKENKVAGWGHTYAGAIRGNMKKVIEDYGLTEAYSSVQHTTHPDFDRVMCDCGILSIRVDMLNA